MMAVKIFNIFGTNIIKIEKIFSNSGKLVSILSNKMPGILVSYFEQD